MDSSTPQSSRNLKATSILKNTLVAERARLPWYGEDGKAKKAFVIGIAGGSGSGKTSVANAILKQLKLPWILIVSQDAFYKSLTPEQSKLAFENNYNFDSPDAFDYDVLRSCTADLKDSKSCQIPVYSFVQHQRTAETQYLYGATIVIVEGIFLLYDKQMRDMLDMKIFVQCDSDLMLARRIKRDVAERGRDVSGILDQYLRFVKPSYDDHVLPTSKHADIIVPGASNSVANDIICTHISRQLDERSFRVRPLLCQRESEVHTTSQGILELPSNVHLMEETNQLKGLMTILRSDDTPADEFIFTADRLATLLVEEALRQLPYSDKTITTRAGYEHNGSQLAVKHLCGVTILRSGACLEKGLRRVLRTAPIGSLLIQSEPESGEPLLYQLSLPAILKHRQTASEAHCLILDSQLGTGAAAMMSIRILLDHGVPEEQITVVVFLISRKGGVHAICKAFPKIRIVTAAADPGLEEQWLADPAEDSNAAWRSSEDIPSQSNGSERIMEGVPLSRARSLHEEKRRRGTRSEPKGKKVFAIVPGLGSFGNRYFGA